MSKDKTIDGILYSSDKKLLQLNVIHAYLSQESYWSQGIPEEIVRKSIEGSLCFAAYHDNKQIAFARVVTDKATFAYLADVFVIEAYRKKGVSKNLMQFIMECEEIKGIRKFMLATRDAHSLYEKYGFKSLAVPKNVMEIKFFEDYHSK
ncbi:MAG TPA: GNAT family N-acetyltransferase [Bacteroidia bacterium]|nr:GNAT family N-acetyltransferase [Bacteroidia bacterium]MBN8691590.1 GNAT family N-acetyltransferase [Bacteroidota bacterium]HRD40898.1 GNAT family N-acetyltransferase [Bacteroidia bacterium]